MVNLEETKGKFPWELGKRISQAERSLQKGNYSLKAMSRYLLLSFYKKLKHVFASIEFQALKLFPVVDCDGL